MKSCGKHMIDRLSVKYRIAFVEATLRLNGIPNNDILNRYMVNKKLRGS